MPKILIKKNAINIRVGSAFRKKAEYWCEVPNSGMSLYIDGKLVKKVLAKNSRLIFHIVNKKIDHFIYVPLKDRDDWDWENFDYDDNPADWCEECMEDFDYAE